jgi:chromosomal replication initiator protein
VWPEFVNMTRWDFESFVVHDANERAVRVCHAIAELHSVAVQPIVICGERGSGKTHLLCATANLARAQSARVALFGITPKYFPDKVRRLAADASQVRDVHQAILLVDDLEGITGLVHELEAVVRAFVESGQPVILCSSIHPERLRNVTPG